MTYHPLLPPLSPSLTQEESSFRLDSEVESKINELRRRKKVAFLSGKTRSYFPDDLGHSKFGISNNPFGDLTVPPPTKYELVEHDRLIKKPISTKGYGIGGLSTKRFQDNRSVLKNPAPNQYNPKDDPLLGREHRFSPQVWMNYGLIGRTEAYHKRMATVGDRLTSLWSKCQQTRAAFMMSMKRPRFGKEPKWNLVGPGHYMGKYQHPKSYVNNTFMNGPVRLNPPTKLHCSYGPKAACVECGKELEKSEDYYRAKYRIRLPFVPENSANKDEEDDKPKKLVKAAGADEARPKRMRVLLCRDCHCKALRGESKYWKRKLEVEWLFEKTRHCSYIHEHNGLPDYTEKVPCYWVKRLSRREMMLDKYYPDKCERRIVKRKA